MAVTPVRNYHWSVMLVAMVTLYTVQAKLVDLSHDHSEKTFMSLPDMPIYKTDLLFDGEIIPGVYAKWSKYSLSEHGGTHIDAPKHFSRDGYTLDQIPLENTIADGVMIDCTEEVAQNPTYKLTLQKIKDWEEMHGEIPKKAAVVINFNWSHKFTNSTLYFDPIDPLDTSTFRFPSVSAEAVNFLVDERDINILATDTMSPDRLDSKFPAHVKMLQNNKVIAENINNPGLLPPRGFRFHASPAKFVGGTGVQTRIYAMVNEDCEPGAGNVLGYSLLAVVMVSTIGHLLTS